MWEFIKALVSFKTGMLIIAQNVVLQSHCVHFIFPLLPRPPLLPHLDFTALPLSHFFSLLVKQTSSTTLIQHFKPFVRFHLNQQLSEICLVLSDTLDSRKMSACFLHPDVGWKVNNSNHPKKGRGALFLSRAPPVRGSAETWHFLTYYPPPIINFGCPFSFPASQTVTFSHMLHPDAEISSLRQGM